MPAQLRAALDLGRVANLPTVATNLLAAFALASLTAGPPALSMVLLTLAGGALLYAGGCTLNDVCDVAIDRVRRPERPLPRGVLGVPAARLLAGVELAAGAGLLLLAGAARSRAGLALVAGLVLTIVLYDLVHQRHRGAVWLMAWCRAQLWLLPAALVGGGSWLVGLWAGLVLLYIAGVSLTARAEHGGQHGLRAAVLLLLLPVGGWLATLLGTTHPAAPPWGWAALFPVALLGLVAFAVREMRRDPPASIGPAVGWLLAAIPLLDAVAIAPVSLWTALGLACGLPATRLLQRHFAST